MLGKLAAEHHLAALFQRAGDKIIFGNVVGDVLVLSFYRYFEGRNRC
jgi:hypothetical protein